MIIRVILESNNFNFILHDAVGVGLFFFRRTHHVFFFFFPGSSFPLFSGEQEHDMICLLCLFYSVEGVRYTHTVELDCSMTC